MKLLKNLKKANNGITLIALVITIIVLLILAGVSIAMLTGENGILTQANNANKQTEIAQAKERAKLDILEWRTSQIKNKQDATLDAATVKEILSNSTTKGQYIKEVGDESFTTKSGYEILYSELDSSIQSGGGEEQAKVGEKVTGSNKYYTTTDGTAKIPVGYMIVPGCEDISEGLVISDNASDTELDATNIVADGNQFVWIPVTDGDKYVRNTSYVNTSISAAAYTDTGYLPEGIQPETDDASSNEAAEKQAVLNAGGFYIGRYEAGDSSATTDFRSSATEGTLVCQKNKYPYTYITQTAAKAKAKTLIPSENTNNVKSALISGIQWDVVMDTINNKLDGNGQVYDVTKASNTELSDRHVTEATTGQNIADKVYNIYDLEGNFSGYVAEKSTFNENYAFVVRGGHYNHSSAASYRLSTGGADSGVSFRPVLYVM